jgi:hypothetical protein
MNQGGYYPGQVPPGGQAPQAMGGTYNSMYGGQHQQQQQQAGSGYYGQQGHGGMHAAPGASQMQGAQIGSPMQQGPAAATG